MKKDVVIIGGGPAGLMAAYQLQQAKVDYILLEKNGLLGKKLLITGQGRCNVTNHLNGNQFINQLTLPHRKFLYSSLSSFGSREVIEFFYENGVPLYRDGELKYFPKSNKAIDIRNVFSDRISPNVKLNTVAKSIQFDQQFIVKTNNETFIAKKVIIATGSKSFPQTGSDGIVLKFANAFGIETIPFYPAETSIYSTFVQQHKEYLQGIAIQNSVVRISNTKHKVVGDLLFTHFGLSGPAVFHLSETIFHELKKGNSQIEVALSEFKESDVMDQLDKEDPKLYVLKFLEKFTTKRLAKFLLSYLKLENVQIATISNKTKNLLINGLFHFKVKVDTVEEESKAYVNGGGVLVNELHPKSMETKKCPGLYFIGEAVDVHGPIGGFNITIAFSMGVASSKHIIDTLSY